MTPQLLFEKSLVTSDWYLDQIGFPKREDIKARMNACPALFPHIVSGNSQRCGACLRKRTFWQKIIDWMKGKE